MKTNMIVAALIGLPLVITGCNKPMQSQTGAAPSEEKQAATGSSPQDKMLQSAPPAAGNYDAGSTSNPPVDSGKGN